MTFLLASMLLSAATIHTNFEGGSLGEIQKVSDTHFRLAVKGESDQDHRNRQANWYYFRVDGASSQPLTLDMVKLPGEYNYRPNRGAVTKDTPPVISYDGVRWEHVKTYDYDPLEPKLVLHIQPAKSRFWIAHCAPYTTRRSTSCAVKSGVIPIFTNRSSARQLAAATSSYGRLRTVRANQRGPSGLCSDSIAGSRAVPG